MKTILRRLPAAAFLAAFCAASATFATPTISFVSPTSGTTIPSVTTPGGFTITVNAAPTAGASISSVQFSDNGTSIGTASGSSPFSINWTPTTAGNHTLTATVNDTSAVTTGASASNNTATVTSIVTVTTARAVTVATTAGTSTIAQDSQLFLRATAVMSDAVVGQIDFHVDGAAIPGATVTRAPYNFPLTLSAANGFSVGAHNLQAVATSSDGSIVVSSANVAISVAAPVPGDQPPIITLSTPAANAFFTVNSNVTVSASANDPDGFIPASAGVTFFVDGDPISPIGSGETNPDVVAPYSVTWKPTVTKSYSLRAQTVDDKNNFVLSPAINVSVVGTVPTISIASPAAGATFGLSSPVSVTANVVASSGASVQQVTFFANGVQIGAPVTVQPYTVSWTTPAAPGSVALTAQVLDTSNITVTSSAVNVSVAAAAPSVSLFSPSAGSVLGLRVPLALSATATASGGATITKVDFLVGATLIGTATTSPYTTTWTPSTAGTASLTARATDSNSAVATSSAVAVTVAAAPTVVITAPNPNASVSVGTTVTISADASAASPLTVSRVDFLANGATIGSATVAPFSISWTPATSGAVSLTAKVMDSTGATTTSAAIPITVSGTSTALSVSLALTGSSTIPVSSARALTATATPSSGIDHVELIYDGSVVGSDTTAPFQFLFTAPNVTGSHFLSARVVDSNGFSASSAAILITIIAPIDTPPVVGIATPVSNSFLAPNVVTAISGTASDIDGIVSSVQVYVNGALLGNATLLGSNWSINWTPTAPGLAVITAVATDNAGNSIAAPSVGVMIADASSPAITLSFSPVAAGQAASTTLPSGAVRNVVANVTPSSGRAIVRVEFFVDGTKVGEDSAAPYSYRYLAPALADGESSHTYVFSARATDNAGASRDVSQAFFVVAPIGQPPTVNLPTPTNNSVVVPNTSVSLAASALANGGTITSVQFYANGSPANINGGNALTAAPYASTYIPTTPGTYVLDAIATDDRGNTAVSNAATITAAFSAPTVVFTSPSPSATARATPNVPLTLSATATAGSGAQVLLVEFLLDGQQIGAKTTPTTSGGSLYSFAWTPTAAQLGAHQLTARVTDTNSQIATSSTVNVNVATAVGTPPTVTISASPIPAQGIETLSQVNFIANAFANGGGSLSSVEFFLNDTSIGTATREQTSNLYRLTYDFSRFDFSTVVTTLVDANGNPRYQLPLYAVARDSNNNQTVSATTTLTINTSISTPPTITTIALSPTAITQGTPFLIGPIFSDNDGTVTSIQLYANGVVSGAAVANPALGQTLTFTPNAAGRFNLFAVATDDTGNTAISTPAIVVNVTAVSAPTTTITRPSDNSTATTVNSPVFLEGTATNSDTTQIPTLSFIATGSGGARTTINGTRIGTTNTYRAIWTPTIADTYSVGTSAAVANVTGTSAVTRKVVVTNLVGLAPTVTITVPSSSTTASTINLTATAADSDGSVVDVEFFVNRNSIGHAVRDQLANTWRMTAAFAGLTPGSTEVVALARDNAGNVAASATSNINVIAATSIAPSIAIAASSTNVPFSRQVQLTANARDTDGTVTSVQYFDNGSSIGTSGNSATGYQVTWTPNQSGTFNVYAVATDSAVSGVSNTTISATIQVTVRRNNPIQDDSAFILQTYTDISNTTPNAILLDSLSAQIGAGTLTRAQLTANLTADAGFVPPVNLLACYYAVMGQWPTPANYTTLLATARGSLPNAVGAILAEPEYIAKYPQDKAVATVALLNNPVSTIPAATFLQRLWTNSLRGGSPSAADLVQFESNDTSAPGFGRGYNVVGLNTAIAEFVTIKNVSNTALFNRAKAAALYYQLDRPPTPAGQTANQITDAIAARVEQLAAMSDPVTMANAVLSDVLYSYRFITFLVMPQSLTVAAKSGAIFSVQANGAPPLSYQWLLNGAPVAGATSATLSLTNVDTTKVGTYTVVVSSSAASATSDPATLQLSTALTRLVDISTRGTTAGGANVLTGGFVVTGGPNQTRAMLIRAVGPTLAAAPFNVIGALADPRLELYGSNSPTPLLTNDNWGTQAGGAAAVTAIQQATTRAGTFALPAGSADAAVLATLTPGSYTVQAMGPAANSTGVVLIEAYDATPNTTTGLKLLNVSTRGVVGTGNNVLIAGFVLNGTVSRRMLIRGVGPTLTRFGLTAGEVLANPTLQLVDQSSGATIRTNDDWASDPDQAPIIAAAAVSGGAFPLANGSKDSAMIVMLPPGAYTAQLSGVSGATGVGIVEVYDVDP